jgi:hypothetical protein
VPQENLNDKNHKELLAVSYGQIIDPDAAELLADVVIDAKNKDLKINGIGARLREYKQLLNELDPASSAYISAHMSAQVMNFFSQSNSDKEINIETATQKFLKDDLWNRIKSCAAEVGKNTRDTDTPERKAFLALGEDEVHAILDRVKEYQLHWESKQPLAAPHTNIHVADMAKEMLKNRSDKIVK